MTLPLGLSRQPESAMTQAGGEAYALLSDFEIDVQACR
jgi:hypothetical protein